MKKKFHDAWTVLTLDVPFFSFFFYVSLEIILDTRSNRLTKELQGYLSSSTINFLVQ